MKLALPALAGAVVTALFGPAQATAAQRRMDASFVSAALAGRLHYEVYLPQGYDQGTERYPVLYVLHGLPSTASAYTTLRFVERALDSVGRPAIVVVPQGARPGENDPEYVDRGPGDKWATAIASELPRVVDARFRTIRSRAGRGLIGISAGGYGAMQIALNHLDEFSVIESWSGYFHPTDPTGEYPLDLGSQAKNDAANVHKQFAKLRAQLAELPLYIGFYIGRDDQTGHFVAENEELNQELSAAGIPHVFKLYPGGHVQSLWSSQATTWLGLALNHLTGAR